MKRLGLIVLALFVSILLFSCNNSGSVNNEKVYTIGITQYNDDDINVEIRKGIVQGLRESGFKEGHNVVYKNQQAKNNDSYVSQINKKFVEDNCDMIISIGTKCTLDALEATKDTHIKVVYAAVVDPKSSNLSDKDNNPITNATGTINKYDVDNNLSFVKNVFPNIKTLGIMYVKNDISSKKIIDEYKYYGSRNNIDIVTIGINTEKDIELAYSSLEKKVDAIMIINDNTIEGNADYIINKSIELKIPVFASSHLVVKKGAIGSYSIDLLEVGKETGFIAGEVLKGNDIRAIKVKEVSNSKLYVNKNTLSIYNINSKIEALKDAIIYE